MFRTHRPTAPTAGTRRIVLLLVVVIAGCRAPGPTVVDDASLADDPKGANWLGFGRTYNEQRFSPLTEINATNVSGLKVDWFLDLPDDRGLVSTPRICRGSA